MRISEVRAELGLEIKSELIHLLRPMEGRELGSYCDTLGGLFQAYGICRYLEDADLRAFVISLVNSGCARRFYLETARSAGIQERFLANSISESFFDAMVSGKIGLARDIALASTAPWNRDWEYEDDHLYFRILHALALSSGRQPLDVEPLLERFSSYAEEGDTSRLQIVRALLNADEGGFTAGLDALIGDKLDQDAEESESGFAGNYCDIPRAGLFIEGLALMRLARLCGLAAHGPFVLCPEDALAPLDQADFPDIFREMQR